MATQKKPGGYWSAENPIPTIQQFMENLDKDKKNRDKQIDQGAKAQPPQEKRQGKEQPAESGLQTPAASGKKTRRTVTDPTTGREVDIDDVGEEFMKDVEAPKVGQLLRSPLEAGTNIISIQIVVPNANLNLPTVSAHQPFVLIDSRTDHGVERTNPTRSIVKGI